ncbi:MAG TPA: CTP synthase [Clostridia bacterium]|nr:CTP synthase [Clostridia bacterium]
METYPILKGEIVESTTKFIFVTGGVVSGLGKGITAASLGRLLKARGLKVAAQKIDPYINVDPGTMSPYQHGEVFVTDDGAETDLDLGHYERFIDENLNKYSNLTSGKIFWNVLNKERKGEYLGETVQIIPHITNEIKSFIYRVGKKTNANVVITEIGGTIGDIESTYILEAIRQISLELGPGNCLFIHVTLVPYIASSGEYKSKPTQHSVKELHSMGISPDMIVLRCSDHLDDSLKKKISLFCNVKEDCVIENLDMDVLYEVPLELEKLDFSSLVCRELGLVTKDPDMTEWTAMIERLKKIEDEVVIALVGKYIQLHDAYLSVVEALKHAGLENNVKPVIKWVDSEEVTAENAQEVFADCHGIIIPGGFGIRGVEGKIIACNYARVNNLPYFGICLGMQIAVVEFARNVCGLTDANSGEFDERSHHKVVDIMPDQYVSMVKGGTMRLGAYPCKIKDGTLMHQAYKTDEVSERHRHRYEINNEYRKQFEAAGMVISGTSPDDILVEAIELPKNDFFLGVQFHPEFKSRPNRAHPLFTLFIKHAVHKKGKKK